VKRETLFLQQWGQSVATPLCAIAIFQLDPRPHDVRFKLATRPHLRSLHGLGNVLIVKRLCGRVRPNRPNAGQFSGASWKHENARESFPSSHSACADRRQRVPGSHVFRRLPACFGRSGHRVLLALRADAHWPSDVLAGVADRVCGAHVGIVLLSHRVTAGGYRIARLHHQGLHVHT
jgi:hypothetical protein